MQKGVVFGEIDGRWECALLIEGELVRYLVGRKTGRWFCGVICYEYRRNGWGGEGGFYWAWGCWDEC